MQNVSVTKQSPTPQVHSIDDLPALLQTLFTTKADEVAMTTGFIKRKRILTGSSFAQSTVFGWLAQPDAPLVSLARNTIRAGTPIKPQSLDQRFNQSSVNFFRSLFEIAFQYRVKATPINLECFKHFKAVHIADSSIIAVPIEFIKDYRGSGNQNSKGASLKLQANLELLSGALSFELQAGVDSDHTSTIAFDHAPNELSVRDLGYFSLKSLIKIKDGGGYFLSRVPVDQIFFNRLGQRLLPSAWLCDGFDQLVWFKEHQLEVRLIVLKVPEEVRQARVVRIENEAKRKQKKVSEKALMMAGWDVRITNASCEMLSVEAVFVVSRLRWQIELFFKVCKSLNLVDESRSQNPFRVLSEIFAKLLGCLVQHWCIVASAWELPERSLFRTALVVQTQAIGLFKALRCLVDLTDWFKELHCLVQIGCCIDRRRKKPSAFQLLEALNA